VVFGADYFGRLALVDPLRIFEEASGCVRVDVHVPEQRELTPGTERSCDLRVGDFRVEPVEGGGRYGQIEGCYLRAPLLERADVHLRLRVCFEVAAGDGGQVLA
jgi:hypothetical protein